MLTQKQEQLLMTVILMMYLSQSIVRLYQASGNLFGKVHAGLFVH